MVALRAEVVFFTLTENSRQGLADKAKVLKHIRQRGDLLLHDGLLQLNTGSGDGHRVSHEAIKNQLRLDKYRGKMYFDMSFSRTSY